MTAFFCDDERIESNVFRIPETFMASCSARPPGAALHLARTCKAAPAYEGVHFRAVAGEEDSADGGSPSCAVRAQDIRPCHDCHSHSSSEDLGADGKD